MSGADMLLGMLTLFNESDDMDGPIQQSLDMLTTALGGRVGEIWLAVDQDRRVDLRYSSSDGSRSIAAFEAAGRALGVSGGPPLVVRVMRTGRASSVVRIKDDISMERAAPAASL
jgi:hypothetical protein